MKPPRSTDSLLGDDDRQRARRAARAGEDKLRVLVDALPVGVAYVDDELRYSSSNHTYRRWFGAPDTVFEGALLRAVLGERAFEDVRLAFECALQGESIMFDESVELDGDTVLELQTTLVPHREGVNVVGVFLLSLDVSDQKRRGDRLARSLRHLSGALDGLDTALVVLDAEARAVSDNAAWRALLLEMGDAPRAPGTAYADSFDTPGAALSSRARETIAAVSAHAVGDGPPVREQQRWMIGDRPRWLAISTSDFQENGQRFVLVSHADVTERVMLEERVRAQDLAVARGSRLTALGELAATMAHELNQPLTAIGNYATLARDLIDASREAPSDHRLGDTLQRLVGEVTRAGAIVHRVNRAVRRLPAPIEPIDVQRLLHHMIERHADPDGALRVALLEPVDTALPPLRMDRVQLEQVLHNLIANALEAIGDAAGAGHVRIGARALDDGSRVEFTVEDDGPGIAVGERSAVFDPFVSTKPAGLGLGLAICRSIVESYGGWISAEASAGNGARLRFSLPVEGDP